MERHLLIRSSQRWTARLAMAALAAVLPLHWPAFCQNPAAVAPPPVSLPTADAPASALFQRVALLGASVTAGFDSAQPFGSPKTIQHRFSHFIEAAILGPHEPVVTHANVLLFMQANQLMEKQIDVTMEAKPTLVVGIDALFWFCYGAEMNSAQRLARFDSGLHLLERIDVPLIVGDLPNASKAVGGILDKNEMPELATLAQCNEKLKAWAGGRKSVTLFPLSEIMAAAQSDEPLTVGAFSWEKGKSHELLQSDNLHPSRRGLAALAIAVLEAAAAANPPVPPATLCHDLETVYAGGAARGDAAIAPRNKPSQPPNSAPNSAPAN